VAREKLSRALLLITGLRRDQLSEEELLRANEAFEAANDASCASIAAMNRRAPQEPVNARMLAALGMLSVRVIEGEEHILLLFSGHAGIARVDSTSAEGVALLKFARAQEAAIAAAEAAPKDEWQPTHQNAEGGLYRFVKDGLMREHDTPRTTGGWVAAIFYENEARQMFATAPSRWLARFTLLPAPPSQQEPPK
jgi:hypothetical protein